MQIASPAQSAWVPHPPPGSTSPDSTSPQTSRLVHARARTTRGIRAARSHVPAQLSSRSKLRSRPDRRKRRGMRPSDYRRASRSRTTRETLQKRRSCRWDRPHRSRPAKSARIHPSERLAMGGPRAMPAAGRTRANGLAGSAVTATFSQFGTPSNAFSPRPGSLSRRPLARFARGWSARVKKTCASRAPRGPVRRKAR